MKSLTSLLLLSCLSLSACSTLNENFDCPAPEGGSCKRMDQVYDMVNGETAAGERRLVATPGHVIKNQAGMMRLWIAPYQDTDGNYHESKQLHTVIEP